MNLLRDLSLVAAGGALGASLRYLLLVLSGRFGLLPWWSTLTANLLGCLLLGALLELLPTREWRLLITTGCLGALTTFSTLIWEQQLIAHSGKPGWSLGYVALSVLAGLACFLLGRQLALWSSAGS